MKPVLRLVSHNAPEDSGPGSPALSSMTDEQLLDAYSQAVGITSKQVLSALLAAQVETV